MGILFSSDGKWTMEIERRVQAGRSALSSVCKHVVWNKNITEKVVFDAMVSLS